MSSNRTFILLCLPVVVGAGVIAYRLTTAEPEKKTERRAEAPVIRANAPQLSGERSKSTARSVQPLKLNPKENIRPEIDPADQVKETTPQAALEEKFRNWRAEGRKIIDEMAGGDREKLGAAFRSALQNQDFKDLFSRSHELEGKWREASDEEKPAIMQEMETIRARGLLILARELGRASANGGNTNNSAAPAAPVKPNSDAPAPAPSPQVFQ